MFSPKRWFASFGTREFFIFVYLRRCYGNSGNAVIFRQSRRCADGKEKLKKLFRFFENMSVDTVPKDLRNLRACLVCSLVKVTFDSLFLYAKCFGNVVGFL